MIAVKRKALKYYLEGIGFRRIERLLGMSHVKVINWVKKAGGKIKDIVFEEKKAEKIALMLRHKISICEILCKLNRSALTISREIKRNMQKNQYKADKTHLSYIESRSKCHRKKLYENTQIVDYVSEKLMSTWSPE